MTRMAGRLLPITVVTLAAVTALVTACGGGSGSSGQARSTTLGIPGSAFNMAGASATVENVNIAGDSRISLSTIAFDVKVVNNTDATDAFMVSVNVVASDNTAAGEGTVVVSDFVEAGQAIVGHGTLLFTGPFPPGSKLVVTKIEANG